MRRFFAQSHPWLMQGLGGLIALIVMIPIAVVVWINVLSNQSSQAAPVFKQPPANSSNSNPSAGNTQPGGSTNNTNGGATSGGQTSGNTTSAGSGNAGNGKMVIVKEQPGTAAGTYVFSPANITIKVGQTVKWIDTTSMIHQVAGLGSAASVINRVAYSTAPYQVTFTKPGTYHYQCQIHLPTMVAVVNVK